MRSGAMVAALSVTKGPDARSDMACSVRAASSLPAPMGPVISTRLLDGAIFFSSWRSWRMAARAAEQLRIGARPALQLLVLALQPRGFERAADDEHAAGRP